MLGGKIVNRAILVDDNVKITSLGVVDQIRLIVAKMSNDDTAELNADEKVSTDHWNKVAALTNFFDKAVQKLNEKGVNSVTIKLSTEFIHYIDEVVNSKRGIGRYYNVEILQDGRQGSIKRYTIIRISKKKEKGVGKAWEDSTGRF